MPRLLAILLLFVPFIGSVGCTWQANSASQAVTFMPGEGLSPANGPGYMNGYPQDMRTR